MSIIRLFDIQSGKVVPTEHCYTIRVLKNIMDNYKDNHCDIYAYLMYMTCPDPELNPFFNLAQHEKEEIILREISSDFSTEDDDIIAALSLCTKLYDTATYRAYRGISAAMDRIGTYMETTNITDGKDGNIAQIRATIKDFQDLRASFKGVYSDLMEEQKSEVRGGNKLAYDQ